MEFRRIFAAQLQHSLKVLTLPLPELKAMVEQELNDNPFLEETPPKPDDQLPLPAGDKIIGQDLSFQMEQITKKTSLQDILLRQLGMCTATDEELSIGQEIIGNIDDNGFLKVTTEEISTSLDIPIERIENTLKIIQGFEPAGVGARNVSECLLIQLDATSEKDPLLRKIVATHLEDVAKKNYSAIAKAINEPLERIHPLIKKILKLNPKPGRNYSTEEIRRIIPDIIIDEKDDELNIMVNNEDIPTLNINKSYQEMLKKNDLDAQTKEFLTEKLRNAQELLRALSKRQGTLRKVIEAVVEVQQDALRQDLSQLKPLTFKEIAQKINLHETTVCRVVMNKYVKTPFGVVALKKFFTSHIHGTNGQAISSTHVKGLIKELIDQEGKKKPLSDQDISLLLAEKNNLTVPRRTVAKYREELKILSTTYRRER